jgi:hypothetical protein
MNPTNDTCPECGKPEGIPIIWGKPPAEAADKIARGEVVCGGCDIWSAVCGTVMNRECQACGHQWHLKSTG